MSDQSSKAFIVHHQSPNPNASWPIDCECCKIRYWTSQENMEAALAAGMMTLCLRCAVLFDLLGEDVVIAGGIKDGKVVERERGRDA